MTVPTLAVEQYQYTDTGVLLNGDPPVPFFDVTSVDGLDGTPVSLSSLNQMGRDGGYADAANEDLRTVTVEGTVYASVTALETYLNLLKANFAPSASDQPFYFRHDDTATVKMVMGKALGFTYTKDTLRRIGSADAQFSIVCGDPRIYSSTLSTMAVARAGNNTMALVGNRDTYPTFILNGPLTAPITITYGSFVITYTVTITTGHSVTIDTAAKTCIDDLGNNVRGNVTLSPVAKWPVFGPGNNLVALGSSSGTGNLTVNARSAWR